MKRSISLAACASVLAALWSAPSPAAQMPLQATFAVVGEYAPAPSALRFASDGLTLGRIFETPADVVSFSDADSIPDSDDASPASSVFSFDVTSGPSNAHFVSTAPAVFPPSSRWVDAGASATSALNLRLSVGGAQATASLQNAQPAFGSFGPAFASTPAVFAFYNFAPAGPGSGSDDAFGFNRATGALGATLTAPAPAADASASSLSSPLISALSPQGPFWYSAYAPPTRGSSVSLSIPFSVAKIKAKVHLGEQTSVDVQSSSLATQILGPAFASAGKYKAVTGGVTLALPLLSRRATVSLDGWYETLQRGDKTPFSLAPYAAQTSAAVGANVAPPGTVVYTPTLTDLQRYVGAASVALPVTSHLTVNGSFSEQLAGGVALDTLTQSLSQHKTAYGGGVAYNFPKTNSSIEFFSNKNIYTDDNVPTYNFTESRQNLYFSVKF